MPAVNPELLRNLRLQFSRWRLVLAPLFFILLAMSIKDSFFGILGFFGYGEGRFILVPLIFCVGVLWGPRLASGAVLDEIKGRTWDAQRMSVLSAWSMTWGKFLGAVSYPWYCLLWICLCVLLIDDSIDPRAFGGYLLAAFGAQLAAYFLGVLFARAQRIPSGYTYIADIGGMVAGLLLWFGFQDGAEVLSKGETEPIQYAGLIWETWDFWIFSCLLFCFWMVFCTYRLLRLQLGYRNLPWGFWGFCLFLGAYGMGFIEHPSLPETLGAFSTAGLLLAYFALLWDEMSLMQCRRCVGAWRRGAPQRALEELPLSIWVLPGVLLFTLPTTLTALFLDSSTRLTFFLVQPELGMAAFLFLLRDTGLFWALCLRREDGGGKLRAVGLVFGMLYLLPLIAFEGRLTEPWLRSFFVFEADFVYLPIVVEIALVSFWVWYEGQRAVSRQTTRRWSAT